MFSEVMLRERRVVRFHRGKATRGSQCSRKLRWSIIPVFIARGRPLLHLKPRQESACTEFAVRTPALRSSIATPRARRGALEPGAGRFGGCVGRLRASGAVKSRRRSGNPIHICSPRSNLSAAHFSCRSGSAPTRGRDAGTGGPLAPPSTSAPPAPSSPTRSGDHVNPVDTNASPTGGSVTRPVDLRGSSTWTSP